MSKPLDQIPLNFSSSEEHSIKTGSETAHRSSGKDEHKPIVAPMPPARPEKPVSTRGRRSLKEFALEADLVNVPDDEVLFQKQYYSIGEVASWFRVNQSLVRYWETEFDILQPRKNRKGDRYFR